LDPVVVALALVVVALVVALLDVLVPELEVEECVAVDDVVVVVA